MSVFTDPNGAPVEIAPGRGDLRFSSSPFNVRQDPGSAQLIGRGPISYAGLFSSQPWIAAAVLRLLTWSVKVPLKCYRRLDDNSRELVEADHPAQRIIERPWLGTEGGTTASRVRLVMSLLGPMLVHGNSVTEIVEVDGDDFLVPRDWRYITPVGPESGLELQGWRYEIAKTRRDIPTGSAVHCAWWSPWGPLGISPLEMLGTTLKVEDAAQRYQAGLFANGARPPSAITADAEFLSLEKSDRQTILQQLREDVDQLYGGPDRAGKPALLPPGLDWKGIGHTAVEAELIDQRRITREEVCGVYQIPPPMLGILDNATYSNIETQKDMAYTDALGPPLVLIEQTLSAAYLRDRLLEDDLYYEFDFGHVLRGDRLKEINAFRLGIASAVYTPNEARRAFNLPPSEEEGADELWMLQNLLPIGSDRTAPQTGGTAGESMPSSEPQPQGATHER